LEIFEDSTNKAAIARIYNQLGDVYNNLGESDWARLCSRKALKMFQDLGNSPDGESAALHTMGKAYLQLGRPRQALALFEQALAISQKIHNPLGNVYASHNGEATILESIGTAYVQLNQEQQALEFYQKALKIHQTASASPNVEARNLDYIGAVHYKLGNQARALSYHLQALGILKLLNHTPSSESFLYNTTGYERLLHHLVVVYDRLGLHTQGVKCYQQAVEIVSTFGDNASEEAIWNYCNQQGRE
ncbi:MAG TPA: tetratricopeptide repeat protein, partial [Oculatellaceae cyanobacterium]